MKSQKRWVEWLWDACCVVSVIGIWPRYIEPRLLNLTRLALPISKLPAELNGLKILQFSDLHWSSQFSHRFLHKIQKRIKRLNPDLIVFTGDLLSRSQLEAEGPVHQFFCSLNAPAGCFAILGNHDYERFVTLNSVGDYDIENASNMTNIGKGFKRLLSKTAPSGRWTLAVKQTAKHVGLMNFFAKTPFKLLCNETQLVPFKKSFINVCGLEEYMLGRLDIEKALKTYNSSYPGIILCHNPDGVPALRQSPAELILCGHTHGGQVNLPILRDRFTCMENQHLQRGLKREGNQWVYVNRGLGSVIPFRGFHCLN